MKLSNKGQHRLFFALDFSDEFKQQLHEWQLSLGIHGRLIESENFHLTLLYLGSIKNHQVFDVIDQIENPEIKNFTLSPGKFGFLMKTEVLYCEIDQGYQSVTSLHQYLKQQTQLLDFVKREKRQFLPHITFARDVKPPTDFTEIATISEHINHFVLMESIQVKSGVIYETVEQWPLNIPSVKQQLLGR